MNYYPFHIGDYLAHTSHLSVVEDCAYRRLLDLYYLNEKPLPVEAKDCARLVRMRDSVEDVEQVLREFFVPTDDGWTHARCDAELSKMQDKQAKAKASAQASVNARRASAPGKSQTAQTTVERTLNERSADVELPTPTPTPTPVEDKGETPAAPARKRATSPSRPDDVAEQVWEDWLQLRRSKKAPVSATVLEGARGEAQKAGMTLDSFLRVWCRRGSQGLEASWLKPDERSFAAGVLGGGAPRESDYARKMRETYEKIAPGIAAKRPGAPEQRGTVIDITPRAETPADIVARKLGMVR